MKLKLSLAEAKILVLRALNLPADTEIVFSRKALPDPRVAKLIAEIEALDYVASDKIAAIKRFREVVSGLGLAEAKWSVENWAKVKAWMKENGRLPKFNGDYHSGTLRMV